VTAQPLSPTKSAIATAGSLTASPQHRAARGHDDAGQLEAEDDGRRPPKEVKLGELVFPRVKRRGATRITIASIARIRLSDGPSVTDTFMIRS
jgi:hypothetical protein